MNTRSAQGGPHPSSVEVPGAGPASEMASTTGQFHSHTLALYSLVTSSWMASIPKHWCSEQGLAQRVLTCFCLPHGVSLSFFVRCFLGTDFLLGSMSPLAGRHFMNGQSLQPQTETTAWIPTSPPVLLVHVHFQFRTCSYVVAAHPTRNTSILLSFLCDVCIWIFPTILEADNLLAILYPAHRWLSGLQGIASLLESDIL